MAPITIRVRTNLTMLRVPTDDTASIRAVKDAVRACPLFPHPRRASGV